MSARGSGLDRFAARVVRACALGLISFAALPRVAHALSVGPSLPYEASGTIVYYYSSRTPPSPLFLDSGFVNVTGTDPLTFEVSSPATGQTVGSGQSLYMTVTVQTSEDTKNVFVPIASAFDETTGFAATIQGTTIKNSSDDPAHDPSGNGKYSYGIIYTPGHVIRLGIELNQLCDSVAEQTFTGVDGCSGAAYSVPDPSTVKTTSTFKLTFHVSVLNTGATIELTGAPDSGALELYLSSDVPQGLTCSNISNIYYPGDGEILFESGQVSATTGAGGPPITRAVVVGRDGGLPDVTVGGFTSNAINARTFYQSGTQTVGPFTNSTATDNHPYTLDFSVRNAGGVVAGFDPAHCQVTNVRTAAINGFLTDSRCFVASAAFRSSEAIPVLMLRQFRDRILYHAPGGKAFVRAYYHYGPFAAAWVNHHPWSRPLALAALIPLQGFAWVLLHLVAMIAALSLGLGCLGAVFFARIRRTDGAAR